MESCAHNIMESTPYNTHTLKTIGCAQNIGLMESTSYSTNTPKVKGCAHNIMESISYSTSTPETIEKP